MNCVPAADGPAERGQRGWVGEEAAAVSADRGRRVEEGRRGAVLLQPGVVVAEERGGAEAAAAVGAAHEAAVALARLWDRLLLL